MFRIIDWFDSPNIEFQHFYSYSTEILGNIGILELELQEYGY